MNPEAHAIQIMLAEEAKSPEGRAAEAEILALFEAANQCAECLGSLDPTDPDDCVCF